jgi:ectoine hydroxylase-related dioxygenase (phytanoyl-CoA dioxygenase family)
LPPRAGAPTFVQVSASPRATLNEALEDVAAHGYGVVAGVLDPASVAATKAALWDAVRRCEAKGDELRGVRHLDPNENNVRVFHLVNHGQVFIDLILHPLGLEAARRVIGDDILISNFSANIALPGSDSMHLHADQGYVTPPWPPEPLAVNVMWLLDDFTDASGATRFVPGSFLLGHGPAPGGHPETAPIEAPAGSMVVMDGRLWHTSGRNSTTDQERAALFGYYVRPWLRQQINWTAMLDPEVARSGSPELLELLGYATGNMELRRSFSRAER